MTTKVSSKYQIVIPREVRAKVGLKSGQTVYVSATSEGDMVLSTLSPLERARRYFVGKKIWGDDPIEERRREAAAWDAKLDKLYDSLS